MFEYFISFSLGFMSFFVFNSIIKKIEIYKKKKDYKSIFMDLKESIGKKSLNFISRVNNILVFKFKSKKGVYDVTLNIDKNQINLIQNSNIVFGSDDSIKNDRFLDINIIHEIIYDIYIEMPQVNDVVAVPGALIDRKTFDKMQAEAKRYFQQNNIEQFPQPQKEEENNTNDVDNEIIIDNIMESTFERIKNGIYFDENLKPYSKDFFEKCLDYFQNEEKYQECIIIRDIIKKIDHNNGFRKN
jgi:hypothetical protein